MSDKLLVVEDNPDNLTLVSWILEDAGYAFDTAESGEECLERMAAEEYELILLDISLPKMDGKEVARQLRAQPRYADLPIVACTAHAIKGESEEIMNSGVNGIVTKPINEDELVGLLGKLMP